jgi:hypothetical protein
MRRNDANMELKNVNLNGENVVESNLMNINFYFLENCKNLVQKQRLYVIYLKATMVALEIKSFILFISQINIECFRASFLDMDLFYMENKF